MQLSAPGALRRRPPRLAIHPELLQVEVDWLTRQMEMTGPPPVRYARGLPPVPPPPGGLRPSEDVLLPAELVW